jgi:YD repeat-containing protein
MKISYMTVALLTSLGLRAQYYYNDIVSIHEANSQMQAYLNSKVKMITATGYDANGVKTTDFTEVREIKENGRLLKVSTRNSGDYGVYYNRYDERGRLISTTDSSSASILNIITYQYDIEGRITGVTTILRDSASAFSKTEEHLWKYNAAGKPEKMWRIINGTDSIEIRFVSDENGNPGEEVTYRWGLEYDRVYYYFDSGERVTDIVRYNSKVKKLLPDVILTYDDNGRIIQKITSTPGENYGKITWVGYIIWRYIYNDKGLKIKEALFDKNQQLTGKIEYSYIYNP